MSLLKNAHSQFTLRQQSNFDFNLLSLFAPVLPLDSNRKEEIIRVLTCALCFVYYFTHLQTKKEPT